MIRYHEEPVLWQYIWGSYGTQLLTDHERRVVFTAYALAKAQRTPTLLKQLLERTGGNAPEVQRDLAAGFEAFLQRVTARILTEHAHELVINRCPECQRIVRTPDARQCFWCGHAWRLA